MFAVFRARLAALPLWPLLFLLALLVTWPVAARVGAADQKDQLLVADLRADELLLVDTGARGVTSRLALPGAPHELLELPDGRVVASIEQHGLLAIADLDSGQIEVVAVGGVPHGLALDGDLLLVTDRDSDQIRRFELGHWNELTPIATARWPHAVAVTSDGRVVVAAALDNVLALGPALIETSELPETVSIASDGTVATAGALGGELLLVDATGAEQLRVALGGRPVRVLFAPDGRTVAVALSASGQVALVDRAGAVRRIAVPGVPDGLAWNRSGDRLYVSNVSQGGVAVIDVGEGVLVEVIGVGTATGALRVR